MTQTIRLAEYLFTRLKQLGVDAIHGVPGDYNLTLLDYVEPADLLWVGNANELNAGYAADGYARMKGLGALVTTYGVGELSAINAIACAYAERAPVVHIVGTPSRASQDARLMIHHTLGDGEYRHFSQMYSHVTVAQTNLLDPQTADNQIDAAIQQCLIHSRPVYIEVPVDMVDADISATRLKTKITHPQNIIGRSFNTTLTRILERIYAAKQPIILVDSGARGLGLLDSVQDLVDVTQWPTFTTISGKSLVDMSAANVHGIYRGSFAQPATKTFFESSDLVLCFGPHFTSTNTYNWSSVPSTSATISFDYTTVNIFGDTVRNLSSKLLVEQLLKSLDHNKVPRQSQELSLPRDELLSLSDNPAAESIKQDRLWRSLATFLRPGDILLGETGTAGYGVREMCLPKHTRLFTPITWLSIGYMLPACQGASLAQRELIQSGKYHGLSGGRTVLLIGDGSFQMTAQELATIIRHHLDVVVFLINNDGYTIERCIHGKNQGYNNVTSWQYLKALGFFGAPDDSYIALARTYGELADILQDPKLADGKGLRMVEVSLEREDAPAGPLLDMLDLQRGT